MNRNHALSLLIAVAAVAALIFYFATDPSSGTREDSLAADSVSPPADPSPTPPAPPRASLPSPTSNPDEKVANRLDSAFAAVQVASNADAAKQILDDLHAYLLSLPPAIASKAIATFLSDPLRDAPTQIEFSVGKDGTLAGHSSVRVALLDWLGKIDPAQAGVLARKILASPTHPDEWAVSLRNIARSNPGTEHREFLRTKTEELIRNEAWSENPSVGFLESFDVLVHARATVSSDLLGRLVADTTPEGKALAHAAYLTLDRLTIHEPVAMMQQLASRPELTKVRGQMVANMFARADLRVGEQRELVRSYLLDPARTQTELSAFAGVYPNANYSLSNNLLTPNTNPTGADLRAHDAAALQIVESWLTDPAFEPVREHIKTMHRRLENFVRPAAK